MQNLPDRLKEIQDKSGLSTAEISRLLKLGFGIDLATHKIKNRKKDK